MPVAPGANTIEVVAEIEGREPLRVRRQVMAYEGAPSLDALTPEHPVDETPAVEAERELRERRTLEIERAEDLENARTKTAPRQPPRESSPERH